MHGAEALSESELLALLLRTGSSGCDAHSQARDMLLARGGLRALCEAPLASLCQLPGLGPAKAGSVLAAMEIGRRIASCRLRRGDPIRGPADVHAHFHQRLRGQRREHFMVLMLDGRHRVMSESQVSQGTLTASLVHPREVFRPAVRAAAAAIVLVHNHPSGDPTPSAEDLAVTQRLVSAGEIVGIRVVDHVVVAEQGFYSLQENGQLVPDRVASDHSGVDGIPGPGGRQIGPFAKSPIPKLNGDGD
jgi:DNA repair protein RadC